MVRKIEDISESGVVYERVNSFQFFPVLPFNRMASLHMIGLVNLGNTCFLNSVLQVLVRCPPLLKLFLQDSLPPLRSSSKKDVLTKAMQTFLQMYVQTDAKWIAPRDFVSDLLRTVEACDDDWYRPRYQADAAECMEYILNGIHDAIYRQVRINVHGAPRNEDEVQQTKALESWSSFFAKEYSAIVDSFHGQSQCKIQCKTCGSASYRYEPWMMLKLAIPGGHIAGSSVPTLTDCLNAEIADEELEGYDCETCKSKQSAVRSVRISRLPDILLISLKRFTNDGKKIRGTIQWDINNLNLQPWTAFRRCPFSDVSDPSVACMYETFGVVEHHGSANSGHYISHVRDIGGKEWVTCDDDSIEQNVPTTRIVSPDSYILCMAPKHRVDTLQTQMKNALTKFTR